MRRISTFLATIPPVVAFLILLCGCSSGPTEIPDQRPGDFRLGVVVIAPSNTAFGTPDDALRDARYIVDSASNLRASFGAGSALNTYPGITRRLNPAELDAIWLMARDVLQNNTHAMEHHAGQPQEIVGIASGVIIEIRMNARDAVYSFEHSSQQSAAIVDALSSLAWVDTTPQRVP